MTRSLINATACLLIAASAALPLAGCSGHGKYTTEGISLAKTRLDTLKAATEFDMAKQAFLAGDLDKASRKCDKASRLSPGFSRVDVLRGRIAIERGLMGEALLSLRSAIEKNKESVDANYYLGVVSERLNENEQAQAYFRRAAELEPHNPQYAVAAGEMLIDLGRTSDAEEFLESCESASHSAGVQQLLGHIALIDHNAELACERFGRARLLAPDDGAILDDLAAAQMAAGRFADAERNLRHLLEDPKNEDRADLLHMRAECLLALGRPVDAREIYRGLTAGDGASDVRSWIGRARADFQIGDDRGCLRAATRVLAIDPSMAEGYMLQAAVHRSRGENAAAIEKLDAGLMRAGRDTDLLSMRALVLSELGRKGEALAAAQAALAIEPGNTNAQRMVGVLAVASVPVD